MSRRKVYNVRHIEMVNNYLDIGVPITEAISKAGFTDTSLFYSLVKRLGYRRQPTKYERSGPIKQTTGGVSFL